ncbi:MAG: hypothetical protein CMJ76_04785 [Planctomycetaceae bacterium]|nr:hypothetical protein [Planctomycetaceae bacterium]
MNRSESGCNNFKACCLLLALLLIGCGEREQAEQTGNDQTRNLIPGVDIPLDPQGDIRHQKKERKRPNLLNLEAEAPPRRLVNTAGVIQPEVTKLLEQIDVSRQDVPTVVAWVIDRSKSAANMVEGIRLQIQYYYDDLAVEWNKLEQKESVEIEHHQLHTLIYTFGETVECTLPLTGELKQVQDAFSTIPVDTTGVENSFAALRAAVDDVKTLRAEQGYEVFLVVVTDEAGDDQQLAEEIRPQLAKYAMPLYVVGVNAPFGKRAILPEHVEAGTDGQSDQQFINQGPETRDLEQLLLAYPAAGLDMTTVDSGYGPFAWEMLCRSSGGVFLGLKAPGYTSSMLSRPGSRPVALIGSYGGAIMSKYAPDYVSRSKYDELVQSNRAVKALLEVAQLKDIPTLLNYQVDFDGADVTRLNQALSRAQLGAAQIEPRLNAAYNILVAGEADRGKLTKLRWQAGYDLAMGRILAARSRVEGYNAMLAALKRGKSFENEASTRWILTPAEETEAGSAVKKIGERAVEYLERAKTEHEGTPWAQMAEMELRVPVGWKWMEQ